MFFPIANAIGPTGGLVTQAPQDFRGKMKGALGLDDALVCADLATV